MSSVSTLEMASKGGSETTVESAGSGTEQLALAEDVSGIVSEVEGTVILEDESGTGSDTVGMGREDDAADVGFQKNCLMDQSLTIMPMAVIVLPTPISSAIMIAGHEFLFSKQLIPHQIPRTWCSMYREVSGSPGTRNIKLDGSVGSTLSLTAAKRATASLISLWAK
jgi:hypothetical protein